METLSGYTIASGVIGMVSASVFAGQIQRFKIKVNLATWTMVLVLDFVGLYLLIAAGNNQPYIQIGWCVAAVLIFLAALNNRGDWKWSAIETYSVATCVAAILVWVLTKSVWSLLGYVAACYVSAIPQAVQYLKQVRHERVQSAWMWMVSVFAISLAIIGIPPEAKDPLSFKIPLYGLLILNGWMSWLTIRR
jgi:hypothetical protein